MSDALCGPSNALQNFQKHSSVDRTLQQDRLVSRPTLAQDFRSSSAQNAGILDPEFEAFQAGRPQDGMHLPQQPNLTGPPGLPDWAADFQRLHVSSPPAPMTSPQYRFQPPASHKHSASWSGDFLRQQPQGSSMMPTSHTPNTSMYAGAPILGWGNGSLQQHQPFASAHASLGSTAGQQHDRLQTAQHDAAFERAFEQAHADMLNAEQAHQSSEQTGSSRESQDAQARDALERAQTSEQVALGGGSVDVAQPLESTANSTIHNEDGLTEDTAVRIDADVEESADFQAWWRQREAQARQMSATQANIRQEEAQQAEARRAEAIQPEAQEQQHVPNQEDEELARTAGQLLDSVAHDTSQKFQQSNFLALMRKLRDHEVRVEGDKVVEVSTSPTPLIPPFAFDGYVGWMQEQAKQLLSVRHHHHYTETSDVTCKVFGCPE
ncbi:hypothetical protein IWZ01DRAFT_430709 [Phyllosticta capitalensis]